MKYLHASAVCISMALIGGCDNGKPNVGSPTSEQSLGIAIATGAGDLPREVSIVVDSAVPGMQIEGVERKERDGRVYYDVAGKRADGSEVELDLLEEGGTYTIVEIQRDIPWAEVPQSAQAAAAASEKTFEPVRVIESTQTDGSVIYELFADGQPKKPSLEVRVVDGKAEVLKEEWMH